MSFHRPFTKVEIDAAYGLLMFENENIFPTWHHDPLDNIVLRTKVCQEIMDYIRNNFHCLGTYADDVAVRIEHYHYVLSPSEKDYLNADSVILKIIFFCYTNNIFLINFEALS